MTQPPPPPGYYPEPYYAPGWSTPSTPRAPRRRLPLAALVVGAVVVAMAALAFGLFQWLGSRPLGEVDQPVTANARQLRTGHCLSELPADGLVTRVEVVGCDRQHRAEVIGTLGFREDSWPGSEVVAARTTAWCEMDNEQRELGFRAVTWTPTAASWARGDRLGLCLAWLPSGTATGSFRTGDVAIG